MLRLMLAVCFALGARSPVSAASGVTSVEPSLVSNQAATTLLVRGTDFQNGAVVVLEGYGALITSFVSVAVLTAGLPAGVPAGVYAVTVVNPDATSATLANALTIVGPTNTPAPTGTPGPTAFVRPLLVVLAYGASSVAISPNEDLDFEMTFLNAGQGTATNISAIFVPGNLIPRATGGVRAVGTLNPGESSRFFQPLTASGDIAGQNIATLDVKVSYTDASGTVYNDTFTLTFSVAKPVASGPAATRTPTPTAAPSLRPQLVVNNYTIDVPQLQPGLKFNLSLAVRNVGAAKAKGVTLIVGGGTTSGGANPGGTAQPGASGGVSGAGGEFTNFAPVESSNVQFIGDLEAGASLNVAQKLIVNATTKAGAYTLKISFTYLDDKGGSYTDDQVITLLVYQPPLVQISFYQPTGPLFAGQPNTLPLQVVNLSRSTAVLGNLTVSGLGAQYSNNVALVGPMDPGFPFTLDTIAIPDHPGSLDVIITVDYTDDFNQPQTITQTLTVEVLEGGPVIDPGGGGGFEPPPQEPETLAQKVWRFIRGLLGLDSGLPQNAPVSPGEVPVPAPQSFPPKG